MAQACRCRTASRVSGNGLFAEPIIGERIQHADHFPHHPPAPRGSFGLRAREPVVRHRAAYQRFGVARGDRDRRADCAVTVAAAIVRWLRATRGGHGLVCGVMFHGRGADEKKGGAQTTVRPIIGNRVCLYTNDLPPSPPRPFWWFFGVFPPTSAGKQRKSRVSGVGGGCVRGACPRPSLFLLQRRTPRAGGADTPASTPLYFHRPHRDLPPTTYK